MATRSTPIPTTAPRARSSCCPQPGFHPSGSRRSKAVCTATYSVELRLLHPGAKLSSERRNEVWSQTELQLFDLFTQLSTDPKVIAVENLTVQPGSGAYTPHGEISQTAKADVIICF